MYGSRHTFRYLSAVSPYQISRLFAVIH